MSDEKNEKYTTNKKTVKRQYLEQVLKTLEKRNLIIKITNRTNKGKSFKFKPKKLNRNSVGITNESAKKVPICFVDKTKLLLTLFKWARQDSNLRPTDYESVALTN